MNPTSVCMLSFLTLASLVVPAAAQERPARPSVTVADFATDRTGWMPPPHLGETLAELVTDRLVAAGGFRIVDRAWLVTSTDGRSQVPFHMLLDRAADAGVDYVVAGSVTRLSNEKRSSTGGGLLPLPIVGGIVRNHKTEQVIGLTIRVIAVQTGEVVATATAEGGSARDQRSGGGIAVVGGLPLIGGKRSSVTGLQDVLLDEAVQQAVASIAVKISEFRIPHSEFHIPNSELPGSP